MVATQHDNNMVTTQHVTAQNVVRTLFGTDNSAKVKKVEGPIPHTKQPQLSVECP